MKTFKKITIYILLCSSIFGYSQKNKLKIAEKKYVKYAYVDATEIFERLVKKGYTSADIYKKIGNSYFFQAKQVDAYKWYKELFTLTNEVEVDYYFRYADCLKAIGEYKKANDLFELMLQKNLNDSRIKRFIKNKNYLDEIKVNSNRYAIANAGINSAYSDYGGTFYGTKFVFTSNRATNSNLERIHTWTNQPFSNIYYCDIKDNGNFETPQLFSGKINTLVNESTPVFTADGKTMYFTRNNFNKGKLKKAKDDSVLLKIYKAVYTGKEWTNIEELPFNSNAYSCAHPTLSADEKKLYFTSDMPGTLGKSDLFYCDINADGTYGTPINLGPIINTEGRETYPFISADNELYFASDGHLGLGGLDNFKTKFDDKNYLEPVNLGTPVNSSSDDFAFCIDTKSKIGFFTSNRADKSEGFDDIFKLQELKPLKLDVVVEGKLVNEETGKAILSNGTNEKEAGTVKLYDKDHNLLAETTPDKNGSFSFKNVKANNGYFIRVDKDEYETTEVPLSVDRFDKIIDDIKLSKQLKKIKIGDDLRHALAIKNIHYDLDSWDIRKDAEIELAKVVEVMLDNPKMTIAIKSFTDSQYTASYNLKLSEKRSQAAKKWLIAHGINSKRITAKGYGETNLVNHCKDGVPCSRKEHEKNRRSEFIITGL